MSKPIDRLLDEVDWTPELPPTGLAIDSDIPYVTHSGIFKIADAEIHCYQLSNGQRILDANDVNNLFA